MRRIALVCALLLSACSAHAVKITVTTPVRPADAFCEPTSGTMTNLSLMEVYGVDSHAPADTFLVDSVPVDSVGGSTYVFDWELPGSSKGAVSFAARVVTRSGRSNVECGWEWVTMSYDTQRPGQPVIALVP